MTKERLEEIIALERKWATPGYPGEGSIIQHALTDLLADNRRMRAALEEIEDGGLTERNGSASVIAKAVLEDEP